MTSRTRFAELWTDFLEGELGQPELVELQTLLEDPSHEKLAADLFQSHRLLGFIAHDVESMGDRFVSETLARLPLADDAFVNSVMEWLPRSAELGCTPKTVPSLRSSSPPFKTIAVGILIGILCVSAVWAYTLPRRELVLESIQILNEDFTMDSAPQAQGIPLKPGIWSGDLSEIVGEHQGIQPASGTRMLRFLRADYPGKGEPGGYISDMHRLIDLRPYQRLIQDGGAVVQCSSLFNVVSVPRHLMNRCSISVYAFDRETVVTGAFLEAQNPDWMALATAVRSNEILDGDPHTWQKISSELRLPPNAEFLLIRIAVSQGTHESIHDSDSFVGHYADDVRVSLARRAPMR